ncbi:MAG: gamma-glutamyl-gamma-aminobutyrate hydrolase family protein [Betaproteobacteria bacterium]|jgi:putative glutamine amidotransferase|nr:gamma-glutamyl-gamma-aminobutyrate hydrolase family protein [Betaproteobacteria bacterium]
MKNTLIIGVSARIYYPDGPVLDLGGVWTRTLHYLEQSVAHWLLAGGSMPVMIPAVDRKSLVRRSQIDLDYYAAKLDALVLQGGNDVAPESYGEAPLAPEWRGDKVRDRYEMALIQAFLDAGKPIFGICRGMQLLNVKFGGTLYQDISTQRPDARAHVDRAQYERLFHDVELVAGSRLAGLYPGRATARVNSIHHQGIKDLASAFDVEARCPEDGMVEAIRLRAGGYVAAVQWHPEFHDAGSPVTFDDSPMLKDFLEAALAVRG